MNKKIVVIALILSVVCGSSKAQVEKQVEVTRAYIPQIEPATKLHLEPDMSDTVRMRPDIDYSIVPRSITTALSTQLYKPATVTYWEFNRPKTAYVKGGVGYPMASVVDVYISNSNPNTNYIIGYLNHEGEYGKVTNDFDEKVSGLNSQNKIGVAAGVYLGSRILEGELNYGLDLWSRSATEAPLNPKSTYQTFSLAGRYGDSFRDLSKLNYSFGVDAGYMFDAEQNNNTSLGLSVDLGGNIGSGAIIASLGYDYVEGEYNYQNNSLLIGAKYAFSNGNWNLDIGGYLCYDDVSSDVGGTPKQYFIPKVTIKNSANRYIQPFVELDGELERYNFAALTKINPYIKEGLFVDENGMDYSLRGGIMGLLANEKLTYSAYLNYSINKNALYWSLVESQYQLADMTYGYDNYYSVQSEKLQGLSVSLDLEYRPIGDLTFKAGGSITDYVASDYVDVAVARPTAKFYLGGEYATSTMRYGIMADIKGVTYTTLATTSLSSGSAELIDVKIPTTLNLKAFAEMELKKDLSLFVELGNVTNSKQYDWMGYREFGMNVMAGVKVQF